MQKKLTITIDENVYKGLRSVVGSGKISRFIQELIRPHVIKPDLENQYLAMSMDEVRENEALEWSESLIPESSK